MALAKSALVLVAFLCLASCVEFVPADRRLPENDAALECGGARVEIVCVSGAGGVTADPEAGLCNRNRASLTTSQGREVALPDAPQSTVFAHPRNYAPKGAVCYALGGERAVALIYSTGRRDCAKCAARDYYRPDGERLPETNPFVPLIARDRLPALRSVWVGGDE